MIKYEDIRKQVISTGLKMINSNMTAGTWGNISARIEGEELMAITPSGVDYEKITPDGIVIMDFNGNIVDGKMKPSIEFPMHALVYKNRKDAKAVVHTHSVFASAFAVARKPIPVCGEELAEVAGGSINVGRYCLPGTKELGEEVIKALDDKMAVLIANHGVLACGPTLKEAFKIAEIVEKSAKEAILANILGGAFELKEDDVKILRNFYLNSYGQR